MRSQCISSHGIDAVLEYYEMLYKVYNKVYNVRCMVYWIYLVPNATRNGNCMTWKYFSASMILCAENLLVASGFPTQRANNTEVMISLSLAWIMFSTNNQVVGEYGPVTIIVPASGHQVHCIPWVQMGTFNKRIGFLCGLKFFALNTFCGEYLQLSLHLMMQIWWKPILWKMCQ